MAVRLSCPQGHRWDTLESKGPDTCPICGAAALTLDQSQVVNKRPPVKRSVPEQFGRYRIIKRLGKGGMGSVYLAHDTQLDRRVALKVPRFGPDDGSQVLARFYQEARAAATIQHLHICPVYDVGEINGIHYLTMAYIEGKPLTNFIDPARLPTARQVAALVRKLALALGKAHQAGVIHRDLKPSNIMINRSGEPVIVDFGLARRANQDEQLTQVGMMLGTPCYMPPEQVRGDIDAMGPAGDIYSLGVIMYQLLTGLLPFEGKRWAVLGRIMEDEAPPPSRHRVDIDPALESVCLKAMAKQIKDRYASMGALAEVLTNYLKNKGQVPVAKSQPPTAASPPRNPTEEKQQPSSGPSDDKMWLFAGNESIVAESYLQAVRRARRKRRVVLGVLFGGVLHIAAIIGLVIYLWPKLMNSADPETGIHTVQVDKKGSEVTPPDQTSSQTAGKTTLETSRDKKSSSSPSAERKNTKPPDGFVSLFNGKDLMGWQLPTGGTGDWKVQDGAIVSGGPTSHLFSQRGDYQDFHLRAEVKINNRGNSGLFFRIPRATGWPKGYEAQINASHRDSQKTGSLYDIVRISDQLHKPDEWFTLDVIAEGDHIIILVNDKKVVEVTDAKYRKGYIALQQLDEGTVVKFRKIEIKELKPQLKIANAFEAEELQVLSSRDCLRAGVQDMTKSKYDGRQWSNGRQLFCYTKQGGYVDLQVELPKSGDYQIDIYLTKAPDYGKLRVLLDGKDFEKTFDGFQNVVVPPEKVTFGRAMLTKGKHILRFQALDKNPQSTNYYMGIDCLVFAPASPNRPGDEGQAILDKAITAHGGLANLKKFPAETWNFHGWLTIEGRSVRITGKWAYQLTDKLRVVINARNGDSIVTRIEILNGDTGWIKEDGITRAMNAQELAEAKEEAYANAITWLFPFKEKPFTLYPVGEIQVEGRPAVGLRVSCSSHRDIDLFFDKKSDRLIKVERTVKDHLSSQQVKEEVFASQYEKFEGILYPMRMKTMRDGKPYLDIEISEYQRREKLNDRLLAVP